jgi:hypothetical protein
MPGTCTEGTRNFAIAAPVRDIEPLIGYHGDMARSLYKPRPILGARANASKAIRDETAAVPAPPENNADANDRLTVAPDATENAP